MNDNNSITRQENETHNTDVDDPNFIQMIETDDISRWTNLLGI